MEIGWGFIGTGRMCAAMVTSMQGVASSRPVAVVSRDLARAEAFATEHRVERAFDSLDEMLRSDQVDAVYIASPNGLHRDQTLVAAHAGKHVLCEKPMATDAAACREMIAACEGQGVLLALSFQYRHHPAHQRMRALVAADELGPPVFADSAVYVPALASTPDWYADPELSGGGGVLPMSGVHRIDLLRFILASEVAEVSGVVSRRDAASEFDDTAAVLLRFENGTQATLRFAFGLPQGGDTIAIHGARASLMGEGTMSQWWGGGGGQYRIVASGFESTTEFEPVDLYAAEISAFERRLGANDTSSLASGQDGLLAVEITAAIHDASRERRTIALRGDDGVSRSM